MQRCNRQGQRQVPIPRTHDLLCHCIDRQLVLGLLLVQVEVEILLHLQVLLVMVVKEL